MTDQTKVIEQCESGKLPEELGMVAVMNGSHWSDPNDRPESYLDGQEEEGEVQEEAEPAAIDLELERIAMSRCGITARTPTTSPTKQGEEEQDTDGAEDGPSEERQQTENETPRTRPQGHKEHHQTRDTSPESHHSGIEGRDTQSHGDQARETPGTARAHICPRLSSTEDQGEARNSATDMLPPATTQIPRKKVAPGRNSAEHIGSIVDLNDSDETTEKKNQRVKRTLRPRQRTPCQTDSATEQDGGQESETTDIDEVKNPERKGRKTKRTSYSDPDALAVPSCKKKNHRSGSGATKAAPLTAAPQTAKQRTKIEKRKLFRPSWKPPRTRMK